MRWEEVRRFVAAVVVVAGAATMVFVIGIRHASARDGAVGRWTVALGHGVWGVAADARGAVAVVDDGSVAAVTPGGRRGWTAAGLDVTEANPALDGATVLVGGEAGVTALDRRDGRRRWHADLAGPVGAVGLAGDVAFAGGDAGTLTAFDAATGRVRWVVTRPGELWSSPRVDPASAAVVTTWHGGDQPHVEVFDLATGASRWAAPTGAAAAAPVVTGRGNTALVVLAAGDGHSPAAVEARALDSGAVRWRVAAPAAFERAVEPAAGRRDVVVADHFGTVTSLDLADGHTRWQRVLGQPVLATRVALTGPRVVLSTYDGTVIVLGRADGRVVAATDRRRLAGYPVGGLAVRWAGRPGWLTGLRRGADGLALLPIP